jgi:hypothetical protein
MARLFPSGSPNVGISSATTILVCAVALLRCGTTPDKSFQDADQSCTQCGAQGVHLVPLQREVRLSQVGVDELVDSVPIVIAGRSDV